VRRRHCYSRPEVVHHWNLIFDHGVCFVSVRMMIALRRLFSSPIFREIWIFRVTGLLRIKAASKDTEEGDHSSTVMSRFPSLGFVKRMDDGVSNQLRFKSIWMSRPYLSRLKFSNLSV
jgi:hypothetical protein